MARVRLPGRNRKFIAVDFDSRHLRIVQAQHSGDTTRVLKLTQVEMPEEMDLDDPAAVGEFLARTLKDLHLAGAGVLMHVPRAQAVLKPLTLPPGTDADELAAMVRFQVEKELSYDPAEAVIDYTITSHFDVQASAEGAAAGINVLAAVVKQPVVDHYRRIARAANIKLLRLGLRPYALLQCIEACTRRREGESVAVVFLTADETEINVLVGNSLVFTRSAVLNIAPPQGGSDPAVKQTVDALVTEVTRSLQSYQTVHGGEKVDAILLAGGTGVESRVSQELSRQTKIQCQTFDPSAALGLAEARPGTSAFMGAIGLAVGHRGAALAFDFLAPKRPRPKRDMRKVRMYTGLGTAAAVMLGVIVFVVSFLGAKARRVDRLSERCDKLKKEAAAVKSLGRYVNAVTDWEHGGRNWLDHWANLCGIFPSCEHVYIDRIQTNHSDGAISFTVKATDSAWIDRLCANLSQAGYTFRRGTDTAADINKEEYRHKTDLKVLIPPKMKVAMGAIEPKPRPQDDDSMAKFVPGKRLPAEGTPQGPSSPAVYAPRQASPPRPSTPSRPKPPPSSPMPGGLTAEEQRWRKDWEQRGESDWKRELYRRKRDHRGPESEALIQQWRREFDRTREERWRRYLEYRRRGGSRERSRGSSRSRRGGRR